MRKLMMFAAVLVLFVAPQLSFGDDVDDLKAASEKINKAYMALDAATIVSMIYPGAASFDRDSAFPSVAPTDSKVTLASLQGYLAAVESLILVPVNNQYKVVGNTGIIWGYATSILKLKGGQPQMKQSRTSSTWIKVDGKWMVLSGHTSAIPSGN
jgi:hypothetical protein